MVREDLEGIGPRPFKGPIPTFVCRDLWTVRTKLSQESRKSNPVSPESRSAHSQCVW